MLHLCPDKPCLCIAGQAQARAVPVTMNEMLLRGCTLKNTGHILGLAVYTGNETRIQKNSAKTPNKIGKSSSAVGLQSLNTLTLIEYALKRLNMHALLAGGMPCLRCSEHAFVCVQIASGNVG